MQKVIYTSYLYPPIKAILIDIAEHKQSMAHIPGWEDDQP